MQRAGRREQGLRGADYVGAGLQSARYEGCREQSEGCRLQWKTVLLFKRCQECVNFFGSSLDSQIFGHFFVSFLPISLKPRLDL